MSNGMWAELFGKKDTDFNEFLINPKELYAKIQGSVTQLKTENKSLQDTLDAERQEAAQTEEELRSTVDSLYSEQSGLYDQRDKLNQKVQLLNVAREEFQNKYQFDVNQKIEELQMAYEADASKAEKKYKGDYDQQVAIKTAELEASYSHEVHEFIEEQNEKFLEAIPGIIRETVAGLKDEVAS